MRRFGVIRHIDDNNKIVRIGDEKSKKSFNAIYRGDIFNEYKNGDNIIYFYKYDKNNHQFPIEILSIRKDPSKPSPIKQVWIHDAFAEMSRRVTEKRKEKK
jgi:hypothetical protein